MMNSNTVLKAMRSVFIPRGVSGLWKVKKITMPNNLYYFSDKVHTSLHRLTMETLHLDGECVMEDSPKELKTHLNFVLKAKGNVLISGLGLGCVVRGCLCNNNVEKITVIERSRDVLDLVLPHMPIDPRLEIVHDCALKYTKTAKNIDYAWHDIWSNPDNGEKKLIFLHLNLIKNMLHTAKRQGAWGMPRACLNRVKKQSWWYGNKL